MEKQLLMTRAFQTALESPMPEKPTMLDTKRAKLRQKLLQEEVKELKDANDLTDVADAICDILYITLGTAHEYGIADRLPMLFDEVHASNMTKRGEDGKFIYRKDGKVMKPDHFRPPNLKLIINRKYHLLKEGTFGELLTAAQKAENKRWNDHVESEIFKRLNWVDRMKARLSSWLEKPIKKKVSVTSSTDESYRGRVVISVYGKETELIDF